MEFNELVDDFASRHHVSDLVVVDGAASLDIDGIIVTIVANGDVLTLSAELGEPPAEGTAAFANALLEANLRPGSYFAKAPGAGPYLVVRRLSLSQLDGALFDTELGTFTDTAETWCRFLADFRPAAKAAEQQAQAVKEEFSSGSFIQV